MAAGVASGAGTEGPPRQGWPIDEGLLGDRIDRVVAITAGVGRSRARELIESGSVQVDGVTLTKPSARMGRGERLEVAGAVASEPVVRPDPSVAFGVVHEEADFVVVDKPGTHRPTAGRSIHRWLGAHRRRLGSAPASFRPAV